MLSSISSSLFLVAILSVATKDSHTLNPFIILRVDTYDVYRSIMDLGSLVVIVVLYCIFPKYLDITRQDYSKSRH